jgi:hypothetical protein
MVFPRQTIQGLGLVQDWDGKTTKQMPTSVATESKILWTDLLLHLTPSFSWPQISSDASPNSIGLYRFCCLNHHVSPSLPLKTALGAKPGP